MRGERIFGFIAIWSKLLYFAGFLLGVAIHSATPYYKYTFSLWLILSFSLLIIFFLFSKRSVHTVVFFLAVVLGIFRFDLSVPVLLSGSVESASATVQNVWPGSYGINAHVMVDPGGVSAVPIKLQLSLKDAIPIGSKIGLQCVIKNNQKFADESAYQQTMSYYYIGQNCANAKIQIIESPPFWDLRDAFRLWRDGAKRRISSALPGDEGILIAGILYGERNLSPSAKDLFRRAGLTHIIAVSGSNFTLIVTLVFSILLGFGLWRHQAFTVTTAVMILFFGFVGFSASVARAALMGWILLLSRQLGRSNNIWYLCLLAASALCLYDPWMLVYDAGFALSFLATIGLVSYTPIFIERMSFIPSAGGLREAAATTFAATLMTTPYISLVFDRVSLAGLFTNLIAVPIVPWAMLFGFISATLGGALAYADLPALGLSKAIFLSAKIADIFPWLDIHIEDMNLPLCLGMYALIARLWFLLRKKNDLYTKQSIYCNPPT